ncbi:DUF4870 domain-containing protein [Nocardiopsis sp. NPDC058789]|uniref:DUF4870 domain-containing protein n=1 Tax=Nocardiopsis sp. NPDC058789 TaxID=3346634 RepID=UPI00366DE399
MSYPNNPNPHDPYGQGESGGYPPPPGYPQQGGVPGGPPVPYNGPQSGGYPPPPQGGYQQPGGYPQGGYQQSGGYPPPHGGPYGGYQQPGAQGYGAYVPTPEERSSAKLAHIGGGFLGWILPLIVYISKKDESPYVRDQAARALSFQLVMLIGYMISWVLTIVLIGFLGLIGLVIFSIVSGFRAASAVDRGEWSRYPMDVTWVK